MWEGDAVGLHCTVCHDYDLCSSCYTRNGHQHPMEKFSTSKDAPGQRAGTSSIQKELQAALIISPVCSQTGQPFVEQLDDRQTNGTMVKQEVKIKIDRDNKMHIVGLLPRQQLYRYSNGELKIHWEIFALQRAHELHYLGTFNCLQLSSLAGYLRSQMDGTEDTAIKQDLQRRIQ